MSLAKLSRVSRPSDDLRHLFVRLHGSHDQGTHGNHGGGGGGPSASSSGGMSDEAAKSFISSHYGSWREGLNESQAGGLRFYQSPGYALMNGMARGDSVNAPPKDLARAKAAVKGLDSAIDTAPPLKSPTTVYRGFSRDQFGSLKPGQVVTEKGYTSTSLTKHGAGAFNAKGKQYKAEVKLPQGQKAAAGSVKELVLPRGQKFKVVSVKGDNVVLEAV